MVFSSFDIAMAMRCDRVVTFKEGRIVEDGNPKQLLIDERSYFNKFARKADPMFLKTFFPAGGKKRK